MRSYFKVDPWCIIEEGFEPDYNRVAESVLSIGNGCMGQRANFEENYSGDTLRGNYVAGVYYPDKTRVGWWKNGYPEYFAKVLNASDWIGLNVVIEGEELDLAKAEVLSFTRTLNMKEGYLHRKCEVELASGKKVRIDSKRFISIVDSENGALCYKITPLNFSGKILLKPYTDFNVENEDSNYHEKFWVEVDKGFEGNAAVVIAETKKTFFKVSTAACFEVMKNGRKLNSNAIENEREKYVEQSVEIEVRKDEELAFYKFVAVLSSENHAVKDLRPDSIKSALHVQEKGFEKMLSEQSEAWKKRWEESDIQIEGDVSAQQGIRFNIFQLNQTYTGKDARLNIGPKGFTGEKYGGSTYWDTEAYCIPFYLATASPETARNLLVYRYKQLDRAIENGVKLGYTGGAALYPMVTMNGEECHNEWEITFEEIHRNGAIAYAIYNYIRYTGDKKYLEEYGVEVLLGIARFWSQRATFSEEKKKYVILGVTGPNEYENNINNNWYTNTIASWCLEYAEESMNWVKNENPKRYQEILSKAGFEESELVRWQDIRKNMFFPIDSKTGLILQQEGYMDKEQILVKDIPQKDLPLCQKWSWDRILRSCFIKQADVLQGLYFFEDRFDNDTILKNFEFYEVRTVHESSLSPCVHSILAAKLGKIEKAYELYLRTARLDIDNYNNDTSDGCHITSMAGTWMSIVQGFGGMRIKEDKAYFNPYLPGHWNSYSFKILFRGHQILVKVDKNGTCVENQTPKKGKIVVCVNGKDVTI